MSFSVTYKPFFRVRVKEQSSDTILDLLRFAPNQETQKLLRDHLLIFKSRFGGFDIYYESNEYASPKLIAPIDERIKFGFEIRVITKTFFSEYEPDFEVSPQFYFDNLTASGNISNAASGNLTESGHFKQEDLYKILPQTFKVAVPQNIPNAPSKILVKETTPPKNTLQTVNINNPDAADSVQVLVNDPVKNESEYISSSGPYILQTNKPNPPPRNIYLDDNSSRRSIHGILDIYWSKAQDTVPETTGKEFQIILKRK